MLNIQPQQIDGSSWVDISDSILSSDTSSAISKPASGSLSYSIICDSENLLFEIFGEIYRLDNPSYCAGNCKFCIIWYT